MVHKKNGGVSAARNLALRKVRGIWTMFLDGDDTYELNLLSSLFDNMQRGIIGNDVDALKFGFKQVDEEGNSLHGSVEDEVKREIITKPFNLSPTILWSSFWTWAYRTSVVRKLQFQNYVVGEDRYFLFDFISRARVLFVSGLQNGYVYRIRLNSVTHKKLTLRIFLDDCVYRLSVLRLLSENDDWASKAWQKDYIYNLVRSFYRVWLLNKQERKEAWRIIFRVNDYLVKYNWLIVLWKVGFRLAANRTFLFTRVFIKLFQFIPVNV